MSPQVPNTKLKKSEAARYSKEGLEESYSQPYITLASLSTLAILVVGNGGL